MDSRACNIDGSTSRNPLMGLVENMLESSALGAFSDGGDVSTRTGFMTQESIRASPLVGMMGGGMASPMDAAKNMAAAWESSSGVGIGMAGGMGGGIEVGVAPMLQAQMMQQQMMMQQQYQHMQMHAMQQHLAAKAQAQADQAVTELQQQGGAVLGAADASMSFVNTAKEVETGAKGVDEVEDFWRQMGAASRGMEALGESTLSREAYKEAWNELTEKLENEKHHYAYRSTVENNIYEEATAADAFAKGMEHFRKGEVMHAIQAFEVASRAMGEANEDESWRMLGVCHAENDDDKKAIICLRRCLEIDPYNLDALLALGTSHVNEMDSVRALDCLRSWITHNPDFHGLELQDDEYSDGTLMDEVMQLMLAAAAHAQEGPQSADVLTVLGVLYNVTHDFDNAVHCFEQVLLKRPGDYSTLNKIGATLANSSRSSDAIPLYRQALEIRPRYTRGWLNLGISHANIGEHADAARAYIMAIRLNPEAMHIYGYLRVLLAMMDRLDAAQLLGDKDVDGVERLLFGTVTEPK